MAERSYTFGLEPRAMTLPKGAAAGDVGCHVTCDGETVLGLVTGPFRPYVFPVHTPAGFAVTSESPSDHPHHNSIWLASDHVNYRVPADGGFEEYGYNFYVNDTFQGRAPGRIRCVGMEGSRVDDTSFRVDQIMDWIGPREWGAPDGRRVVRESRVLTLRRAGDVHELDIVSVLAPHDAPLHFGPTRHALANVRVAPSMASSSGGRVTLSSGAACGGNLIGGGERWVDCSGPVGGGHEAGVTMMADPRSQDPWWFVSEWGVITLNPFRKASPIIPIGGQYEFRCRLLVHDGDAAAIDIEGHYRKYASEAGG